MSLNDCLISLTIVITVVPLLKMAREKRFGFYNISIVIIGITILILSIVKNRADEHSNSEKERQNKAELNEIKTQAKRSNELISKVKSSLDTIGLRLNDTSGLVSVKDKKALEKVILAPKTLTNVTSIQQQGGQTAGSITNTH